MTIWLRTAVLCSLVSVLVGLGGIAAGEDASPSLAEYKSRLDQYKEDIQKVSARPDYGAELYSQVPPSLRVEAQSRTFTVSLKFLHEGLDNVLKAAPAAKATILSKLEARIAAMRAEADSFGQARDGDPAVRERLNKILSAREFSRMRGPGVLDQLWERVQDWMSRKLDKLFPSVTDLDQLGQILVWIMIGIVSAILAVWLYRRSRERILDHPKEILPFIPSAKSWRIWLAEAREKASLGEWREAIHLGFWAAVSRLESDGVWRPDKTRTPREYLNAIPAASESKVSFAAATKTFEAAWYGGRLASAGEFERFMGELEKLGCKG